MTVLVWIALISLFMEKTAAQNATVTNQSENQTCQDPKKCLLKPACACRQYRNLYRICAYLSDGLNVCNDKDVYNIAQQCSPDLTVHLSNLKLRLNDTDLAVDDVLKMLDMRLSDDILSMNAQKILKETCIITNQTEFKCPTLKSLLQVYNECDDNYKELECSDQSQRFCILSGICIPKANFSAKCSVNRDTCINDTQNLCKVQLPKLANKMGDICKIAKPKYACSSCLDTKSFTQNITKMRCGISILDNLKLAQENLEEAMDIWDYSLNLIVNRAHFSLDSFMEFVFQLRDSKCIKEGKQCSLANEQVSKMKCKKICKWDAIAISKYLNSSIKSLNSSLFMKFSDYIVSYYQSSFPFSSSLIPQKISPTSAVSASISYQIPSLSSIISSPKATESLRSSAYSINPSLTIPFSSYLNISTILLSQLTTSKPNSLPLKSLQYEQEIISDFKKVFATNCSDGRKTMACDDLKQLLMILECKSCSLNESSLTGGNVLDLYEWQQPGWLGDHNFNETTCFNSQKGTLCSTSDNSCSSYDDCYNKADLKVKSFCSETCYVSPSPTVVVYKTVLKLKSLSTLLNMEGTSVKEIISSFIIADEAVLGKLNVYFESHTCLKLQCGGKVISSNISTLIDKVGQIQSENECKVKVRVVYSANDSVAFEMELRKADCAGRVGGSSVVQCKVTCVDPQLADLCCPQNKILGESRCCNISTCNGKCYYNNSCASEANPCSLPNKCGICVSPGKDFSIGIDKCGHCAIDKKPCNPDIVYVTEYQDMEHGNLLKICFNNNSASMSEALFLNNSKKSYSLTRFGKCRDVYFGPQSQCNDLYTTNQLIEPGNYNIIRNGLLAVGEIIISVKDVISFLGLPDTIEMGESVNFSVQGIKDYRIGQCCIKKDMDDVLCKPFVNGNCSVSFCNPGTYVISFKTCSELVLVQKVLQVNCSVPKLLYRSYGNTYSLFFKCPLTQVTSCSEWIVGKNPQYLVRNDFSSSLTIKQKCFTSCSNDTSDTEILLPQPSCMLENIPPKQISQCQDRKILMCLDPSITDSIKSDNISNTDVVVKISGRCMIINQMQVKNGDKFRICDTKSSCCQEHVFEVETVRLGIRLEEGNHFSPYLSCGKQPETGYSWKLKMLGDVIYQSDAQHFFLSDELQFKYAKNVATLSLNLTLNDKYYSASYENIEIGNGKIEIFGVDKGGCQDGDPDAIISFRIKVSPNMVPSITCNDILCSEKMYATVPCGGIVRVCATVGMIAECLNLANKKDPLPPIIKVVEQKVGKLCFISNLNSLAFVTINGIPASDYSAAMVTWIGKSSSAKIFFKPETAGTYEFFIVASNNAGNTSETVTVFVGDVPYLCNINIYPTVGVAMETDFSIQLTYGDDVTSKLIITNVDDSATSVTFKDKKFISMKFPHGGKFSVLLVISNDYGQSFCAASVSINETQKDMAELASITLSAISQTGDTTAIIEAASSLCARLSQSELSSSQSDAMQEFFLQVILNMNDASDEDVCVTANIFSNKPSGQKPLPTSRIARQQCLNRINIKTTPGSRKRRSLDDASYYPSCTAEYLLGELLINTIVEAMVKSIFPISYNEIAVNEKNQFLSISKLLIESLCSQISKTDRTEISIINNEVRYFCHKVINVNNDTVCFGESGHCISINSTIVKQNYESWDCEQDGNICEGYFIGTIWFLENVMSDNNNTNFTFTSNSIDVYFLNPSKSCVMEVDQVRKNIKIVFPYYYESAECMRYDSHYKSWRAKECVTLVVDNTTECRCSLAGPVTVAFGSENEADILTTKATTDAYLTSSPNNTNITEYQTKKVLRLVYNTNFTSTVFSLGGYEYAKNAFCKPWLSVMSKHLTYNCTIYEGSVIVILEIKGSISICEQYTKSVMGLLQNGTMNIVFLNGSLLPNLDSFTTDGVVMFTTTVAPVSTAVTDRSYKVIIIVVVVISALFLMIIVVVFVLAKMQKKQKVKQSPTISTRNLRPRENPKKLETGPRNNPGIGNPVFDDQHDLIQ